jgi:ribosomal protein L12E/L44/L45/RPP1/RPP2
LHPELERKKLLRVIHRAQRHLSSLPASDESAAPEVKSKKKSKNSSAETSESEKEKWERELREARIMLNYVLQYP